MDIAASLIKLFFGSKADKDRKEVEPYLVKIKAVYPTIEALSNDELRDRSEALKKQIADFIAIFLLNTNGVVPLRDLLSGLVGVFHDAFFLEMQCERLQTRGHSIRWYTTLPYYRFDTTSRLCVPILARRLR